MRQEDFKWGYGMLVIKVGLFLLLVMGCDDEDTAPKNESNQTEACLDIADEVVEMTAECETTDQSLQSCKSTISAKLRDMSECFAYLAMKCAEEANDDLQETCKKQIRDDFAPVEVEIKKIKARIGSKDQADDEE